MRSALQQWCAVSLWPMSGAKQLQVCHKKASHGDSLVVTAETAQVVNQAVKSSQPDQEWWTNESSMQTGVVSTLLDVVQIELQRTCADATVQILVPSCGQCDISIKRHHL